MTTGPGVYQRVQSFEERMAEAAQGAILKLLASTEWLRLGHDEKLRIGVADLRAIFDKVDMQRVTERVLERVEDRIANAIVENMATEIGTDVKKIFCNPDLREDLRGIIKEKIRTAAATLK
jgi:hypothetical protein